mgnify:CR=1 FL=1
MWWACATPAQFGVGAELRLFSGKSVASVLDCLGCWEGAGTAWEGAGAAFASRQDDDDDLLLETTAALLGPNTAAAEELRPHCEGQDCWLTE